MSKASKSARAMKRKKEKAGRKQANKARYEAMTLAGQNQKSKRVVLRKQRSKPLRTTKHRFGPCRNTGCRKCDENTRRSYDEKQARIADGVARAAKELKQRPITQTL